MGGGAMKKGLLLSLVGGLLAPAWAGASPLSVSGGVGGTAAVVFEGLVTYQPLNFSGQGTIISKDQTSLVFILTADYTSEALDFNGNGFRWTEEITNDTGQAWSSYSLVLGSNGAYFTDGPVYAPTFVTVSGTTVTRDLPAGTLTLSADRKRIDLVFASSILSGGSFSVHTPI